MKLHSTHDPSFRKYGKLLNNYDLTEALHALTLLEIPAEGVRYVASESSLEQIKLYEQLKHDVFGQLDIQFGYCCGHKSILNALEYHATNEVDVMATDAILLLGSREFLSDTNRYNTNDTEAFFVPAGTMVELYANTLHFSPFHVGETGFHFGVVLPRGTNVPLPVKEPQGESAPLLTDYNKWLIGHPEANFSNNVYRGLDGINPSIHDIECDCFNCR